MKHRKATAAQITAHKAARAVLLASTRSTTLTEEQWLRFSDTEEILIREARDSGFMEDRADVWEEIQADMDRGPTDAERAWARGEHE